MIKNSYNSYKNILNANSTLPFFFFLRFYFFIVINFSSNTEVAISNELSNFSYKEPNFVRVCSLISFIHLIYIIQILSV